ncbi:MAG: Tad domain-containing protein [Rhodobacteraceae bacterium]|nr:Tad domain-containing protein [Paracoccaceae bacterium]
MTQTKRYRKLPYFASREDGGITILGLYIFMMMMIFGGLAIDVTNVVQARAQLQIAADNAGHAALFWRDNHSAEEAKDKALEIAYLNMPNATFGEILKAEDIQFGTWDRTTRTFTPDANSRDAVYVSTKRQTSNNNALSTYLLHVIGVANWELDTGSVWERYVPGCLKEGFVADSIVDVQSNNVYKAGFCIHSNTGVELNNNNVYEPDSVVSMPDWTSDLTLPSGGFDSNDGLEDALHTAAYEFDMDQRINNFIADLQDPMSDEFRTYINSPNAIPMSRTDTFDSTTLVPGNIYSVQGCSGNQKISIPNSEVLTEIVLITNCKVQFGSNAQLIDSVVATTNTNSSSISAASGFTIGADDDCAPTGDAQILTLGGISIPAGLKLYGAQMLAAGDASFTANATGTQGASVVAGGTISGTTNMEMAFCGNGMAGNFKFDFFRMVQ